MIEIMVCALAAQSLCFPPMISNESLQNDPQETSESVRDYQRRNKKTIGERIEEMHKKNQGPPNLFKVLLSFWNTNGSGRNGRVLVIGGQYGRARLFDGLDLNWLERFVWIDGDVGVRRPHVLTDFNRLPFNKEVFNIIVGAKNSLTVRSLYESFRALEICGFLIMDYDESHLLHGIIESVGFERVPFEWNGLMMFQKTRGAA